jgi:hypothetical protein
MRARTLKLTRQVQDVGQFLAHRDSADLDMGYSTESESELSTGRCISDRPRSPDSRNDSRFEHKEIPESSDT